MTTITALPTPVPTRQDPASFAARGDALIAALPDFVDEANALAAEVNSNATAAASSATAAATSATSAASSASTASTQATAVAANAATVATNKDIAVAAAAAAQTSGSAVALQASLAASSGSSLIGFVPSGAGAVATDVEEMLRRTVSVDDFMSDADRTANYLAPGSVDVLYAFTAAFAHAKLGLAKRVEAPAVAYKVSGSINIHGNFGEGIEFAGNQTKITSTANAPIISINCRVPDTPPQVRMNAYVHGFSLVGPGKANTSSVGVKAQRGAGVKVENLSITGVYIGLHGFGNLISHYSDINIYSTFMPMQFEPDGIEFAPNDLHFTRIKAFDNDRTCRMINFPNGAMTFTACELEGNNLAGSIADGVKVAEFTNAGLVTMKGCHMEGNPGQYNLYFDGNNNAHLVIDGCEIIPGDSAGTVLYMANVTAAPTLTIIGSRVTNNVQQVYLSAGVKAFFVGTFAGQVAGSLANVVWLRDGRVVLGRQDPLAGGNGVIFPATPNLSTDPNTLDDYAEGTFTPTVIGGTTAGTATYTVQNGRYTKIGRLVFVELYVNWSAGTGTGDLWIGGLPFNVAGSSTYPGATISRANTLAITAGNQLVANFEPNQSQIRIFQLPSGGGAPAAVPYDAVAYLMISGCYSV